MIINSNKISQIFFILFCILTFTPLYSPSIALISGIIFVFIFSNPYLEQTKKLTTHLLSLAVIGLGFGLNLEVISKVGMSGVGYTIVGISLTFLVGIILQKLLKTDADTSLLITAGTAICGGSAIAAVAPVIKAKPHQVSVALGTVFLLNALALVIFPSIGHFFNLTETQFGTWSALAVHDTSSVIGTTLKYGATALQVGTTLKLTRALWIIPMALIIEFTWNKNKHNDNNSTKAKKPWFILGFILAATLVSIFPEIRPFTHYLEISAKKIIILTLFLIGTNLNKESIKSVGAKPIFLGIGLWIFSATTTLIAILSGWIN